ncbi:TonB-dependent receptor [Parafilimonas sp.]|uniref:TonB-dependent receptor n=1 Tax=Parafilimonas sp. TaxID=1969739 RepID=UPI0039E5B267
MARIVSILSLLMLGVSILAAQTMPAHIQGIVSTNDNKPAAAVTVLLKGTNKITVTNNDGYFVLGNVAAGSYQLEVALVGYKTLQQNVMVEDGKTIQLHLQLAVSQKQLGDVVVTGQYMPQSLRNAVYRVRVIDQATIKMRNATDVLGVLNNELGVRFSNDLALGETDVQIMGMSGQNVKVLLDGVPLIDRNGTKQSLSQVDINSVERIEIVEGPMSVVYGTDALAGVINIITKKGASTGESALTVAARAQEETVGNKEYNAFTGKGVHNENIAVAWRHKGWHADVSVTRNNFGGWQGEDTGRAKEWMPKDQWLSGGTVGYRNATVHVWYRLNYLNEVIHSLGDVNPNTSLATDADYTTNRYMHQAQFDWIISHRLNLNTSASYQQYSRATQTTTYNVITRDRRLSLDTAAQDVSRFNTVFFRSTAQYIISPSVSVQPGIEYQRDNASGERIEGSPVISNYAFFVSSEIKPIPGINIRPGIRISKNSTYDAPPVIPSINTKFTVSKTLDARAAYARGFRAPALRELYFWFFDANHSIKGNPDLKAEYSNSFNGSLTWQPAISNKVSLSSTISGFYNDFNNRIDLALGQDASNPSVYTYINIAKYKTTGGTWQNMFEWKQLTATLGVSYIGRYNEYSTDTTYNKGDDLPEFTWSPEISSNIMYNFKKAGVQAGLFYKYTGKLPLYELATINNEETIHLGKTAAYNWADFNVRKSLGKYATVSGGIKNIFNVTRLNNTSADVGSAHSTGGPVPMSYGRSCFLGLQFNWAEK